MILLLFADENKIDTFYKPFKIGSMEVVTIEKRTFSYVCERFTEFAKRIESLCSTHTQKVENWLDSQEVCLLLGVSKRTLQYYRSSGRLAYSQIGSKIYYKTSDIERIIADRETQNQSPTPPRLMKRIKKDYPFFNLFSIVGTWESINLNPTVIIYRSDKEYLLSIIYVSETTKQASPATYEIQQDGSQYFIAPASKRLYVDYDPAKDVLNISSLGHYLRN